MKRFSRIALLCMLVLTFAVGGSVLATAKGHGSRHATKADVVKDVKDNMKDSTDAAKDAAAAQNDTTTPDSPAEAQKEQADAQKEQADNSREAQEGQQEGDNPAQAAACKGLLTDNVQYDNQTGTCSAETGQGQGHDDGDNTGTNGVAGQNQV